MSSSLRIKHFLVPAHALPRYAYTSNRTLSLLKRYTKRIDGLRLRDEFQIPTYGDVQVYYLHDETSIDLSVVNVAGKDGEHVQLKTLTLKEYKRNWDDIEKYAWSLFVTPAELLQRHKSLLGSRQILIKNANEEIRTNEGTDKITYTSPDNLREHIGILLERDVLGILFERLHIVQCLIEIKDPLAAFATLDAETTFNSKKVFAKHSEKEAVKFEITTVFQLWYKARCMGIEELIIAQFANAPTSFKENLIKTMLDNNNSSLPFPESQMVEDLVLSKNYLLVATEDETQLVPEFVRDKVNNLKTIHEQFQRCEKLQGSYKRLVQEVSMQRRDIEQLCGEMQGLFYRSMVPLQERPKVMPEMNHVLDEQPAKEIFRVKGVVSAGYRFSTLNIFLYASISGEEKESTETDLTQLMNCRNVLKYVFCYEQKDVTQFREVGSTISVHNQGTLGGFAALGANKEMCVLLARHLADQSDRVDPWVYVKKKFERQ